MSGNKEVVVPYPYLVLHSGRVALACNQDGEVLAEELHGLFAADTRVLSTYRFGVGGYPLHLLAHWRRDNATVQWEFENRFFRDDVGEVQGGSLLITLERHVDHVLRDRFHVTSYLERRLRTRFALQVDADFADIFEVKGRTLRPRVSISRSLSVNKIVLSYEREGFKRGLEINFSAQGSQAYCVGSQVIFDLDLPSGGEWECEMRAVPIIDGVPTTEERSAQSSATSLEGMNGGPSVEADTLLALPFRQGQLDLHALAVAQDGESPYIAAGAPWFLALFGRDSLMAALMAGLEGAWMARGILAALAPFQAGRRDDWRDAEPGKLPHELRRGEMAWTGEIPHTPYYGTHDTPALYCLTLWNAWSWTGDRSLVKRHLETARAALRWCEELGDRDGDGFQEYATRSRKGYRNQGWKDAGDAIVHSDGRLAEPPLATVELQGYLFAARLAIAEILEEAGEADEAQKVRKQAFTLRALVEDRFWMEKARFYALALDKDKRLVTSITSNPAHLLWCGLPTPERAGALADRLLQDDMFSGWGMRTLSARNPAYNPLSYQRGSVWPHDTALAAAGLWRYGLRDQASKLLRAILDAAEAFEGDRLPELFCGLDRGYGMPIPYDEANVPQAWASAAPILMAQLFLGLVPDAPHRRCFLDPWLPEWLPRLEVRDVSIGGKRLSVVVTGQGTNTRVEHIETDGIEVVQGTAEAPLWGAPPQWD